MFRKLHGARDARKALGDGTAPVAPPAVAALSCLIVFCGDFDMPIGTPAGAPTLVIRKEAFERAGLTRARLDQRLNLTADEFRIEGTLIAVGPIHEEPSLLALVEELEELGLVYFDDFFELSGNWPTWLKLFVMG